ncbi:MAG: hypothetical protein ABI333_29005 [bacterium]
MNEQDSRLLWERGLQFLGGQTAAQCHEVTNVLNIINEYAGLLGDLLHGSKGGEDLDLSRLETIAQKIATQVRRGETIVRAINQFAHSADTPRALFDVQELLGRICFIAQRPANLARTELHTRFPEASITLENSPLGFEQAVFTAFEIALASSAERRRITVGYTLDERGVEIGVHSADPIVPGGEAAAKATFLAHLMAALRGAVTGAPGGSDAHRIVLFFPRIQYVE